MINIKSEIGIGNILSNYSNEIIKNEPMFFNCSWNYAYENGGEPTKEFLLNLPSSLHNEKTIIDSRVHMLMKNWYPCIPGYHHDDVPRNTTNNQPNYTNPSYRSNHALILYNGDICPTEFALGEANFSNPNEHTIVYKEWHREVENHLLKGNLKLFKAPSNQIIFFDDRTWHQGTKAIKNGWRLFIRASWNTERKATNEIRKQVQVYLENPTEGW